MYWLAGVICFISIVHSAPLTLKEASSIRTELIDAEETKTEEVASTTEIGIATHSQNETDTESTAAGSESIGAAASDASIVVEVPQVPLPKPRLVRGTPSFDCDLFHSAAMAKGREANRISAGPFDSEVKASSDVRIPTYPPEYQKLVDDHWEEVLKANPKCFDGVVYGLDKLDGQHVDEHNKLTLKLQKTSYRHLLFSHCFAVTPDKRHLVRPEFCANAVGVSALTLANDGSILLGKRSAKTPAMPGYWHLIPAGCLDRVDVMSSLQHEMLEELGLDIESCEDVKSSVCLGLFSAGREQNDKPELTWRIRTTKSRGQLRELFAGAKDRAEHAELAFVGPNHQEILDFIRNKKCTEVLQVLLEMHMETDRVNHP